MAFLRMRLRATGKGCQNKFKWLVMELEFRLADKETITQLFYVVLSARKAASPTYGGGLKTTKQSSRWQTNLLPRCRSWNSARLKVCHLYWQLSNRLDRQAVDNVEVWMTRIRDERKEAKNEV
jgi:hypothetical protein